MLYAVLEKCYPKKMKFHILFFGKGGGQFKNNYWCDSELHHLLGRTPVGYIHRTCEDQVYRQDKNADWFWFSTKRFTSKKVMRNFHGLTIYCTSKIIINIIHQTFPQIVICDKKCYIKPFMSKKPPKKQSKAKKKNKINKYYCLVSKGIISIYQTANICSFFWCKILITK